MKHQDWTDQLRERLADYEEPVPADLWAGIEQHMAAQQSDVHDHQPMASTPPAARRSRIVPLRRWMAAAAACALLLFGLWLLPKQDKNSLTAEAIDPSNSTTSETFRSTDDPPTTTTTIPADDAQTPEVSLPADAMLIATVSFPADGSLTAEESLPPADAQPGAVTLPADGVQAADASLPTTDGQTTTTTSPLNDSPSAGATLPPSGRDVDGSYGSPTRSAPRVRLGLHATNLMAFGGSNKTEQMQMSNSYMGYMAKALSRKAPVYLSGYDEEADHKMPVTLGLSLRLPLGGDWWVATGLNYSRVSSTFTRRMSSIVKTNEQRLHYVGIPLQAGWSFWQTPRLSAYASAGVETQFNVSAQLDEGRLERDRVQFSVLTSAGIEYKFLPQLSVYLQPGLRYYPDNGSAVQNIFKEHPLQFDFQVGLRLSLSDSN